MPILNFKEIHAPNEGSGRDAFELFARDFLESAGFKIIVGPDRGPDAGRDLVVEELRAGVGGETRVRWLVSCKHKAHSGAAVKPEDENDIHDRVKTHGCDGFIGFYSTVPSSGLAAKLNSASLPFQVLIFDPEKIEAQLLSAKKATQLPKRYFPVSFERWANENPLPAKIFRERPELRCCHCNANLLEPTPRGIIVVWATMKSPKRFEHVYWCCKGECDSELERKHYKRDSGLIDGWEDIPDLAAPVAYLRWISATLNEFQRGETYSENAFERYKEFMLNLFPLISREMTEKEHERIQELSGIPAALGGWHYPKQ